MENNDKQIELKFQRFFIANFPKVKNFAQMLLKSETEDVYKRQVICSGDKSPSLIFVAICRTASVISQREE